MKISLFYKSYAIKAYSLFILVSLIASVPTTANAGFFNDLMTSVIGQKTQAADKDNTSGQNSQTIPLLETSIDPDMNNNKPNEDVVIDNNEALQATEIPFFIDAKYEKSSVSDKIYVYTVEEGDTLSQIAETFDVSVNTIRWENNLSGQSIKVGQKLNILPVTGVKHIVKKGDTIGGIANKYDAESEDIYIFNDISSKDTLKQGDIIFVPNGIIKAVVSKGPSGGSSSSSNTKVASGYYLRPVSGRVTSSYGSRRGGFHYGIDFGNSRGTSVSAAASGKVVKAITGCTEGRTSCGGRYGNYVVVQHSNGTKTFYAHLQRVSVSIGDSVSQGEQVGTVGNTGRSTGPHLHFEIENANGSKMRPVF